MSLRGWLDGIEHRDWQTTDDGTVRYALIGLGWWAMDVALPALEASDRCEPAVLVSSSRAKATELAAEHDLARGMSYEEYHDGVAADAYDAVYIATPNAYHLEYAETAAAHDAAVICEKPLEATAERAEALVEACADVPLMTAYRMQTDPRVRRAKDLIAGGALGEIRYVTGTNEQPLLEVIPDPDQWRLDPELTGYGTSVMDLGIYVLNTARFLLDRDPVEAYAYMGSAGSAFADVPDQWATYSLLLEGGVPLLGATSQDAQAGSRLSIVGEEGRIDLTPAFSGDVGLTITRGETAVEVAHDGIDVEAEMREEFDYFADRVLSGEPIYPDGAHGLVDMRTIAAIHRAAEAGEPVGI